MGQGPVDVPSAFPQLKQHTSTRHGCHQKKIYKNNPHSPVKGGLELLKTWASYLDDCETRAGNLKLRIATVSLQHWELIILKTHPINHMKSATSYIIHHPWGAKLEAEGLWICEDWSMMTCTKPKVSSMKLYIIFNFQSPPYNYNIQIFLVSQESPVRTNNQKKHLHLPSTSTPHPETTAVGMGFSLSDWSCTGWSHVGIFCFEKFEVIG